MALRNIILERDARLRKRSRVVEKFDERLAQLLDDMAETMYDADGVGLAAPQVGVLRRAVVIDVGGQIHELINPEITFREGEQEGMEGCLSCPQQYGIVIRPQKVIVQAQDRTGKVFELEGEDHLARAICHETDHLDGRLFKDIMERLLTEQELEDIRNASAEKQEDETKEVSQ